MRQNRHNLNIVLPGPDSLDLEKSSRRSGLSNIQPAQWAYARGRRLGFTIVELLVVMTVATVLLSLAANVAQDIVQANQVTTAGETVVDELRLARYTAITRNRVVEVRFYKPTSLNAFGEESGVTSLQAFMFDQDNNKATPVREVRHLPNAVKISEDATLSTLITAERLKNDWKTGDDQIAIGDAGTDYTAYRVRFLPDGSTDLDTQQRWFLTLYPQNDHKSLPSNYVTVQVKPSRGNIRAFRP